MLLESKALVSNNFFHTIKYSYSFKNSDHPKISFFNDGALKLGHFDYFRHAFSISGIR